jgi:thymidylate kinase
MLHRQGVHSVVQAIEHERNSFYFVFVEFCEGKPVFFALDVSADYRRDRRVFFAAEDLLREPREAFEHFDVPSTELEFVYYLVKKISKRQLDVAHVSKLDALYAKDPERCERQLHRFFPQAEHELITNAARSRDWGPVRKQIRELRRALLSKLGRENKLRTLQYWVGDLHRLVRRILQPTGIAVAFLGVDGAGKSTVIDRVEQDLAPAFRRTAQYRLRPRLRKRKDVSTPVTEPHAQPLRGLVASLAKLAYWFVDYTGGWIAGIHPQLVRSTLVLFDRYYHDVLVDSRRYRYGGPLWLARFLGSFIFQPNLTILLDAPPEILGARKSELTRDEIARQRKAYLDLLPQLHNGHLVDASRPCDEVVVDVEKVITEHMKKRMVRRFRLSEEGS